MLIVGAILLALSPFIADTLVKALKFEPELRDTVHTLVIVGAIDVSIFVASGVFYGAFYGFQKNEVTNAAVLFAAAFKAVVFYFALTSGYGLVAMGIISLVGNLLAALLLAFIMRKVEPQVEITVKHADKSTIVSIFNYSKFTFSGNHYLYDSLELERIQQQTYSCSSPDLRTGIQQPGSHTR